jgi:hypothetical protein
MTDLVWKVKGPSFLVIAKKGEEDLVYTEVRIPLTVVVEIGREDKEQ